MTARTLKNRPRMKRICKHGAYWNKAKMNSGRRCSRRNKQRVKKANEASLLSVENSHSLSPKKIVEVKDKWVKVRVTMDSGAAGHVMPETMFPRVKLERKTSPRKFVAVNGEQIKDLGEKNIPFKTNEGIQRCISFRSANVVKPSFQCNRSSEQETLLKRIRTSEALGTEQRSSWT